MTTNNSYYPSYWSICFFIAVLSLILWFGLVLITDNALETVLISNDQHAGDSDAPLVQYKTSVIILSGILLTVLAVAFFLLYRLIHLPLRQLQTQAEMFLPGTTSWPEHNYALAEVYTLAEAIKGMRENLTKTIEELTRERDQQSAIFSGMKDGLLLIDNEDRVMTANGAASALLGVSLQDFIGRPFTELKVDSYLQTILFRAVKSGEVWGSEYKLAGQERYLEFRSCPLTIGDDERFGTLITIHNTTQLKRLEKVRRDFVANVSHELKTPVTSIKGFVETLLDGTLDNREDAVRFLKIVASQADRLTAIIEDLLTLARLESEEETMLLLQEISSRDILETVALLGKVRADEKGIEIIVEDQLNSTVVLDRSLVEQALINLLDNAVKYSEHNREVVLRAYQLPSGPVFEVEDRGPGIAKDHLPRLFERFYRVDKARSRNQGGTGLGLAIVKHIATVHEGSVKVSSEVGKGSVFSLQLPFIAPQTE